MKTAIKRTLALALILIMVFSMSTVSYAATGHFDDVTTKHWAYENIEKMAEGGLVSGYGNRKFGPNDSFTIAQMSQIICNALGYETEAKDGYWAYGAVDYCINSLHCLPDFGPIVKSNYDIGISRELTAYMLVNGLGVKNGSGTIRNIDIDDIPDWHNIDPNYRDAVEKAYRNYMTEGIDAAGTFNPKATLTRAEGVTMLVRAGYTTAPVKTEGAKDSVKASVAWEALKKLGAWKEVTDSDYKDLGFVTIQYTDPKYGGLKVSYKESVGYIEFTMVENYGEAWYDANHNLIDVNGKRVDMPFNEKTYEFYCSAGYSYSARQFVKKAFACIVGSDADAVYASLRRVFNSEVHVSGGGGPNDAIWAGNRCVMIEHARDNYLIEIVFFELGDEEAYTATMQSKSSAYISDMRYIWFGPEKAKIAYELDRW